ncbi:MAG: hypothetical protein RKO25_13000 [Candidatus Contendobacter sp.]|nr:hypothetical protein [Candidatus Contendobacter sp.]
MRDMIRTLRHCGLYLLPASLLVIAGALLVALLCYPIPSAAPNGAFHSAVAMDHDEYWRSHAESLFAAMMAESLRRRGEERRDGLARTLEYRYERFLPFEDRSTGPAAIPPGLGSGVTAGRPSLIRL